MSMRWTEQYLRTTGDAEDAAYADLIAEIHHERGRDIPLPTELLAGLGQAATGEGGDLVLAEPGHKVLDTPIDSILEGESRLQEFHAAIQAATEPYRSLFDKRMQHPTWGIWNGKLTRGGVARWAYQDRVNNLQLSYNFSLAYSKPRKRVSQVDRMIMTMASQQDKSVPRYAAPSYALEKQRQELGEEAAQTSDISIAPWLRLDYTYGRITTVALEWYGAEPRTAMSLLADSPAKSFYDATKSTISGKDTNPVTGQIRFDLAVTFPQVQFWGKVQDPDIDQIVWNKQQDLGIAQTFIFNPDKAFLERFTSDPVSDETSGSRKDILNADEYIAILQSLLSLIPTRPV